MSNIKVGNLIYRIYPSGHRTLGMAIAYDKNYKYNLNLESEHNAFLSFESYELEGGIIRGESYGAYNKAGRIKFEYKLIPPDSLQEHIYLEAYNEIINQFKRNFNL